MAGRHMGLWGMTRVVVVGAWQPLTECMAELHKEKAALGVQLTEPWLREHQVLPQRSHPMMQMSGSGGYLLHGITLAPGDASMLQDL